MPNPNQLRQPGPLGRTLNVSPHRPMDWGRNTVHEPSSLPLGVHDSRILLAGPPTFVDKFKEYKKGAERIRDYYQRAKKLIDPETRPLALFDELFKLAMTQLVKLFGKGIKDHPFFKYHEEHFKILRKALKNAGTLDAAEIALEKAEETVVRMNQESYAIHLEGNKIEKGLEYDRIKRIRLSIFNQIGRKSFEVFEYYDGTRVQWKDFLFQLKLNIMDQSEGSISLSADEVRGKIDLVRDDLVPEFMRHTRKDRWEAIAIAIQLTGRFALLTTYLITVERYLKEYEKKLRELEKSDSLGEIMADNKRKKEQLRFRSLRPGANRVRKNAKDSLITARREVVRWVNFAMECSNADILLYEPGGSLLEWPWVTLEQFPLIEE